MTAVRCFVIGHLYLLTLGGCKQNISSPPRVSRRRSNGQEDAVVSASPVGKNKNGKTTSANRFAALADLSVRFRSIESNQKSHSPGVQSINETETESSASTGSPASDTQETMSVELVGVLTSHSGRRER